MIKMIKVLLVILVCLSVSLMAENTIVTYEFPKDTCFAEAYTIDQYTNVHLTFNGDFGSQGCRTFTLKAADNPFYFYQICWHKLYYKSPKCQSELFMNYLFEDVGFVGKDCQSSSWNNAVDGCFQIHVYGSDDWGSGPLFYWQLLRNNKETSSRLNNDLYYQNTENKNRQQPPARVNDTFKIEIYASFTYNYTLIGAISGGVVGLFVIIVVVIVIVRCLRRRKRATGMYCCSTYQRLKTDDLKLEHVLSNECSCVGFTLWSCIICRRRETSGRYHQLTAAGTGDETDSSKDSENKLENMAGLQDPNSLPSVTRSFN